MSSINHDYISTQILTTTINIKPDKITGDINQLILHIFLHHFLLRYSAD